MRTTMLKLYKARDGTVSKTPPDGPHIAFGVTDVMNATESMVVRFLSRRLITETADLVAARKLAQNLLAQIRPSQSVPEKLDYAVYTYVCTPPKKAVQRERLLFDVKQVDLVWCETKEQSDSVCQKMAEAGVFGESRKAHGGRKSLEHIICYGWY